MSRQVSKTSAAMQDLVDNATYLGEQSPGLEIRFLDAVEQTLDRIVAFPEIGGIYETRNPRLQGIRVWRVNGFEKYLVFYRPGGDGIDLIRILHGARDIAAIFGDD